MKPERFIVRSCLTVIAVGMSLGFFPIMLLLKLLEGVYASWTINAEAVRQIWAAEGLKEFDR